MSLQYDRLTAKNWPALDGVIESFLDEHDVESIESVSMGPGATGNPEARLFWKAED